ncbi:MAG: GNAT family N-acetyltransferase [Clostridia bacterium]|nr:GNAT family N-acetyltransferase [Clostridia bacterium]
MEFKLADDNMIEQLVQMRLEYIEEDLGQISHENRKKMMKLLPIYFAKHMGTDLFPFVALDEDRIVSTAFLVIFEKPSSLNFMNGRVGDILNVYTKPDYRHKGIASKLMKDLMEFSKGQQLDYVELKATQDGYSIYQKCGFKDIEEKYQYMRWY